VKSIDVKKILAELTIEEKAGLCSGADFWHTKAVERLKLPNVMVSDGPHGLRKQDDEADHIGIGTSIKAVCFPTASVLACSFDRDLLYTLGTALGDECQAEQVSTILGPAVNMKRSPLCGRNFEYFSEDPYLAGELAAHYVNGVQSKNIGTSLKHFAANNQETRRMSISSEVDERTLREIYLAAFETIVKKAQPWTVMCSYNCINGTYSCENDWLLNQVLRKEWGFHGLVVTDWGAMNDRVKSLKAGLDLEMPASNGITDKLIVEAVNNGTLTIQQLDVAVTRVLELVKKFYDGLQKDAVYDKEEHHQLARRIANESAVLLKNDDHILPIKEDTKVAFIGEFAVNPRFQGGGSSHINCFKITNALDAASPYQVAYAKGFDILKDELEEEEVKEAQRVAREVQVAVIFAGLPDRYESEGYDRTHLNLPANQNALIDEIVKVQPNTIVVLHNGAPVVLPWIHKVKAVLEVYLSGQAVGESTVDLLYGRANPSGKLAETFPLKLQDNPSYLNFPGTNRQVEYREGLFIGYRYYDAKDMDVLFPFGFGLSYTTFEYSDLQLKLNNYNECDNKDKKIKMKDTDQLLVSVKVKNTGSRFGKEIVQLYVQDKEASVIRPLKELKGFEKVSLEPGEEKTVTFTLEKRSFAFYNTELQDWFAESGDFDILIGKSSRDILLTDTITLESSQELPFLMDDRTTLGDILNKLEDPSILMNQIMGSFGVTEAHDSTTGEDLMMMEMMKGLPLHSLRSFSPNEIKQEDISKLLQQLVN
jgi:beta-glucosidase